MKRALIALAALLALVAWNGPSPVAAQSADSSSSGMSCVDCHEDVVKGMAKQIHMRIEPFEVDGRVVGCEGCHGDGEAGVRTDGVWSDTKNLYTNNKADYQGYFFTVARPFAKKKARVRFRGRYYETDTSDYFYDTVERVGVAGPHAGKTYRDVYGIDVDYLRHSSLNRKVWDLNADLTYKVGRKAGTVTGTWKFKDVNREYYQVAPGETQTTTNILGAMWRPRPARGLRFSLGYRHAWVTNPYTLVGGACSDQVTPGPLPSPFLPQAAPYYTMRDARIMDTTGMAGGWDELKLRGSYTKNRTMVTALYRYWDGSNTEGNLTDWERTNQTATVTFAWMPAPTWDGFVSYNYQKLENSAPVCIAIFDG